jgi:XTP/dITP diphosphohydrolase
VKLLLATNNQGKVREFTALLAGIPFSITTPQEEGLSLSVEETGDTLEENASLKARAFSDASGLPALADDSGLFVDALGGEPGVRSARYAGPDATDEQRVQLLLDRLKKVPEPGRTAVFRCTIAVATPAGAPQFANGECRGIISQRATGEKGFGYDPIFFIPELGKTMAELDSDVKNRISHRGKATVAARSILQVLAAAAPNAAPHK